MDVVKKLYNDGKLLVRAMDFPLLKRGLDDLEYDCTTWANEFCLLMNGTLSSASSTLIVPTVGVSIYKSIGFFVNSDLANCFHISKSDSSSYGNTNDGDFFANKSDFQSVWELANYIKTNNYTAMNEVNINTSIDSVEGLFFVECKKQDLLLQMIYVVRFCLKKITGIDYPIYSYDVKNGKLNYIELTDELEKQIVQNLKSKKVFYWPDDYEEPVVEDINNTHIHSFSK